MKLCVIIPALNEEATIGDVIARVPADVPGVSETAIVVVDDGSTDRTAQLSEAAGATVVSHGQNRGVGAAFHTGVDKALEMGADLMVNMDGDGQFDPEEIPRLLAPLLAGEAQFVSASRFMKREYYPEMSAVKLYGNKLMSALVSALTGVKYYDVSCGFRAYTRDALLRLNLFGGFTYTQETFLDLSFKGVSIREVPVRVRGTRRFGKSRVASNLPRYCLRASRIIFRSFRDYRPMAVFGGLAGAMFVLAVCFGTFLLIHYARVGELFPHRWAGFAAAFLAGMGTLVFTTGLVADMLARIRANQERILYLLKKRRR